MPKVALAFKELPKKVQIGKCTNHSFLHIDSEVNLKNPFVVKFDGEFWTTPSGALKRFPDYTTAQEAVMKEVEKFLKELDKATKTADNTETKPKRKKASTNTVTTTN